MACVGPWWQMWRKKTQPFFLPLSSVDSAMSRQIRSAGKGLGAVFPDTLVWTLCGDGAFGLGGAATVLGILFVVHVFALGVVVQINVEIEVNVASVLVLVSLEFLLPCLLASRVEHASDVHGWNCLVYVYVRERE